MIIKITDKTLIEKWNYEHPESKIGYVVNDQYKRIHRDLVQFENGKHDIRYVEENTNDTKFSGVHIVPTYKNGVLLEKIFRYGIHKYVLEFPRGIMELNEDIETTAARELYEEIGAKPKAIHRIGIVYEDPAKRNSISTVFAIEVDSFSGCHDEYEFIDSVLPVPFDHVSDVLMNEGSLPTLGIWTVYQNWVNSNKR